MAKPFVKAGWIWIPGAVDVNQYADFYETFHIEDVEEPVILRISADSQYAVFINDDYVYAGQYGDFPSFKVYDEIDITSYARAGENQLHVLAYCAYQDSFVYRRGDPGAIFEVLQDGAPLCFSGGKTLCAPNANYQSGEMELISPQLGFTFAYDATKARPELIPAACKAGAVVYNPRPIARPELRDRKPGLIVAQGVFTWDQQAEKKNLVGARMQYAGIAHRDLKELTDAVAPAPLPSEEGLRFACADGDGLYLLVDLGEEDAGFLDIELTLDAPAEVLIGWGEHTDDLRLRTFVGGRNFAARYMARAGRARLFHPLRRAGLRYVQLFIAANEATIHYAGVRPTVYPAEHGAQFHTADALHDRIHQISVRTLITCMHEHYEDCPWREQALYAMDSRNQMLAGYYALGEYDFPRASLKLLGHSLRSDGMLEICAPARGDITIPSFTAMFIVALYEYVYFSADFAFALEMLPTAFSIADAFCAKRADNGLIPCFMEDEYWNFYEWSEGLDDSGVFAHLPRQVRYDAPLNAFIALALDRLARLLKIVDKKQKAAYYYDCAAQLRKDIHAHFWNKTDRVYDTYIDRKNRWGRHELTQALCVYAEACPENHIDRALEKLTDGSLIPVTLSHTIFKYDALMKRPQKYSRWVFADVAKQWGHMLYNGATTFWETIDGGWDFMNAGSLCHGWSAVPSYLYYAYALGVKPTAPGFATFEVAPVDSGLYELKGTLIARDGRAIELG